MSRQFKASGSVIALAVACAAAGSAPASAQEAPPAAPEAAVANQAPEEGVIIVSGVRQSIESSIDDKRRATEIKDTITAEDIGQLANDNISEALQRITGVQVDRSDDGEGKGVQIRGLSENNVQINGETLSGSSTDRGVNFQDLPAELFSGVEIQKALTADSIEGTLGGTINLKTRAPLDGKKDFILNLNGTHKITDIGDLKNQDASLLVIKQFRDTGIGDIGVLLNFGYKETASVAEVYGGGDFDDAPAIWLRKLGGADPTSTGTVVTAAGYNYFAVPTVPNQGVTGSQTNAYRYALEDPNGDGTSTTNDVYYIPGQFGFAQRTRDDTKKSFNGTLQWRPTDTLDIRFDTVLTDIEESLVGSTYSINSNAPRSGVLIGGPGNVFTELNSDVTINRGTANGGIYSGPIYIMESGRLGSFTNRIGAAPSINRVDRKSQQYSLEADWDITPTLNFFVKGSTSKAKANTVIQAQLNTGIEHQGGAVLTMNAADFYNVVDFNLGDNKIPNVTFYESPFPSQFYGVTSMVAPANLKALNPADINYIRQAYFQYQRNAADIENKDDSLRFDLTWEPDVNFITAVKAGFRWAERSFDRSTYQNANQNSGSIFTAFDPNAATPRAPATDINIQRIPVNPASTTDLGARATSTFLQSCLTTAGREGMLSSFGGNLPTVWGSTSACDMQAVEAYFNMRGIRELNEARGIGYYERTFERIDVSEETKAVYLRADFLAETIGGIEMYGNVGIRYIKTETTSSGDVQNATNNGFSPITYKNSYEDWLPSLNLNFALADDLILRAAYNRTLGRPGLVQLSPGLTTVNSTDVGAGYTGFGTQGNPLLKPVRADNFDASLEWYYDKGSFLSAAVFKKNIDTTIFLGSDFYDYTVNNNLYAIRTYGNFGGTQIKGLELGMAHAFNYLPGFLRHLGVTANYTIIDESSDLLDQEGDPISRKGLSDKTMNLGAYYDDGKFSIRLAYNKRTEFTRRENVSLGFQRAETLPEIEAGRDQLDLALRYKLNKYVRMTFNAINLTNEGTVRYMKYEPMVNYLAFSGRKYNFGVALSF